MEKCCEENNCRKTVRSQEEKKKINSRINRIIGQLNGVKRMIAEDRYCEDVLVQLSAVGSAVKSVSSLILDRHLHSCVVESIKQGDDAVIDEIMEMFKRFS